jgi:hypothetical protein
MLRKWITINTHAQWQFGIWLIPKSFWFSIHIFSFRLVITRPFDREIKAAIAKCEKEKY